MIFQKVFKSSKKLIMMNFLNNKRGQLVFIAIVLLALAAAYFFFNPFGDSPSSGNAVYSEDARVININAQMFSYSPDTITVKKGEKIRIVVNSVDTTHGIAIPDFGVSGVGSVEFTADKAGTFQFKCPTYCGSGHKEMTGTLIVEE